MEDNKIHLWMDNNLLNSNFKNKKQIDVTELDLSNSYATLNMTEKVFLDGKVEYYSDGNLVKTVYDNKICYNNGDITSIIYEDDDYEVDLSLFLDEEFNFINDEMLSKAIVNVTDNVASLKFPNDSLVLISNNFVVLKDSSGEANRGFHLNNGNLEDIDVFSDYNVDSGQYGGNQMVFYDKVGDLLSDKFIMDELNKKFPGYSIDKYEEYLKKIGEIGSGYTALVDSVFKNYEGREIDFYNTFGFNMYDMDSSGNINYNYEYLILKWCDYNFQGRSFDQIVKGDVFNEISPEVEKNFQSFLSDEYKVHINELTDSSISSHSREEFMRLYNDTVGASGKLHMYMASKGYNLYDTSGNLTCANGGDHAMYITDINSDGNLIVSSWGQKYILDLSDIEANGGDIRLYNFEFVN